MKISLALAFLVAVLSCNGELVPGPSYDGRSDDMPATKCKDQDFCLHRGAHYPWRQVNRILMNGIFPRIEYRDELAEKYDSRFGDEPSFPECDTQAPGFGQVFYIKHNNNTRVVVQSARYNVKQKYQLRWCTNAGETNKTRHFDKRDLQNVTMTCDNVNTPLNFMVLTLNQTDIEMIAVELPVYCKARYRLKHKNY